MIEPVEYYSFSVVDAWDAEPMDDGGDNALIVVRMTDMNGRLEHYEMVEVLVVMSDGTPARCYWSGLDRDVCVDDLDADGDMMFGVGDGLSMKRAKISAAVAPNQPNGLRN